MGEDPAALLGGRAVTNPNLQHQQLQLHLLHCYIVQSTLSDCARITYSTAKTRSHQLCTEIWPSLSVGLDWIILSVYFFVLAKARTNSLSLTQCTTLGEHKQVLMLLIVSQISRTFLFYKDKDSHWYFCIITFSTKGRIVTDETLCFLKRGKSFSS